MGGGRCDRGPMDKGKVSLLATANQAELMEIRGCFYGLKFLLILDVSKYGTTDSCLRIAALEGIESCPLQCDLLPNAIYCQNCSLFSNDYQNYHTVATLQDHGMQRQ